jgi:hypothetical protein
MAPRQGTYPQSMANTNPRELPNVKIQSIAIPLLSSLLLAACGGGGGGGGAPAAPAARASLDASNQVVAAQEATSTAFLPMLSTQTLVGAQTADESVLFQVTRQQLGKLPGYWRQASTSSTLTGVVQTDTYNCTFGGTTTVSVSDTDNNGMVSAGDSATITGNNCTEAEGTLSGALGLSITSLSGDYESTSYGAAIALTFNNLTVTNAQFSASLNGSLTLSDSANGLNSRNQTFAASTLTVSATYAGVVRSRSLASYSATITRVPDAASTYLDRYSASGVVTSSALSSLSVTFATTSDFVTRAGDVYPYTGAMTITGASNSQLSLTALSNSQLTQKLDADGNGTFESSSTVNWNTLL